MVENILAKTGATDHVLYITGSGNYRNDIAVTKPYKGNRSNEKPTYYNEILDYMMRKYNTEIVHGKEADDAMGIAQTDETVIASIDKDLDMIPGLHYNWRKDLSYFVSESMATQFFYKQLLMGDSTDNIPGVPGVGKVVATTIISKLSTEEDMYWAALHEYSRKYKKPFEALMEMATLLWIQREEDKLWEPKW